ncbi:two-component system response regulator CreB [Ignatzschineria sp. LJL83]
MTKILLVEDEKSIADTIIFALKQEGFSCDWVTLGTSALEKQQDSPYDFWVLDVGLPDMNGFEVCKSLRKFSDIPVIFLTARDSEIDRIVGLEIGADDYMAKPFSPRELVARIKVILKRMQLSDALKMPEAFSASTSTSASVSASELESKSGNEHSLSDRESSARFKVDHDQASIFYAGKRLPLTRHEYQIFAHLLAHPKHVLSRDQLLNAVGVSLDSGYERTVDTHIKSIRAKLRDENAELEVIKTHRGFGYSFEDEEL